MAGHRHPSNGFAFEPLLDQLTQASPTPTAVVVDQFEELFATTSDIARAEAVNRLTQLLEGAPHLTLIFVMRDEFYSHFVQHETFAQWIQRGLANISPILKHDEVVAIVHQPAAVAGWRFEEGLIETIVEDALTTDTSSTDSEHAAASTILPLLEFALTQLWERRSEGMLTHEAYEKIGGVTGGLTQWADQAFYGFEERLRPLVRHVFTALVHLGNEDQHIPDTRRCRELTSLARTEAERTDLSQVVQRLVSARLLVISQDPESKKETVEIVHDALLREWGLLKQWLAEDRRFLAWHQKLEERVQEWVATAVDRPTKRDKYKLVGGRDLTEAEDWLSERKADLSQPEQVFIEASKKRQRREVNCLRFFAAALSIFSVVVIILASAAQVNFLRAESATKEAQAQTAEAQLQRDIARSQALAANANYSRSQNQFDQALLLSKMAYQTNQNYQSRDSLLSNLEYDPQIASVLRSNISSACDFCTGISSSAYSPDGRTLIVSHSGWGVEAGDGISSDGLALASKLVGSVSSAPSLPYEGVTLWDMQTKQPRNLLLARIMHMNPTGVAHVAFSPDGKTFASAGYDGGVQLWDAKTGALLAHLTQTGQTADIAFSPDGKFLAVTNGMDHSIVLYDLAARKLAGPAVASHMEFISHITFSPNGKLLAVAGCSMYCPPGQIQFWTLTAGKLIGPLEPSIIVPHTSVLDMQFSPDGKLLATGNEDGTITLWDVASKQPIDQPLSGHKGQVNSLAFNSSGSILASASDDKTVRLWNVATRTPLGNSLIGHSARITSVAWSSNDQLASGDSNGTIILWDTRTTSRLSRVLRDTSSIASAAFSPDGKLFASGDDDGKIMLRDGATMAEVGTLSVPAGTTISQEVCDEPLAVMSLVFSPDGRMLAANSWCNGTILLWDVKTRQVIAAFHHPQEAPALAFSPDSHILAIAGKEGGIITLWDMKTQKAIRQFTGDPNTSIDRVAFSPDGGILASFSYERAIILWDMATGKPIGHPLTSSSGKLVDMAFSPNGNTLAGITGNGVITLWDARTTKLISQFYANDGSAFYWSMAFSTNGRMLAVAGQNAEGTTISVRDMTSSELLAHSFRLQQYPVYSVMFSPDGSRLASLGTDNSPSINIVTGIVIVSDINPESWQARVCSIANRNFTADEWRNFANGVPYQKICPDRPVHESKIKEQLVQAQSAAKNGDRHTASDTYRQAAQGATETSNPILNNYVCWYGNLDQFAKEVMPACERAVNLEPDNGIYRDSRGVARALLGDYRGAIEDFQFFIAWAAEINLYTDKPYIAERNAWIDELKTGRNPLDTKTLEALRDE